MQCHHLNPYSGHKSVVQDAFSLLCRFDGVRCKEEEERKPASVIIIFFLNDIFMFLSSSPWLA